MLRRPLIRTLAMAGGLGTGGGSVPQPGTSTLSNARTSPNGEYLVFDTSGGAWAGLIKALPGQATLTMTVPSSDGLGNSVNAVVTRRIGLRALYPVAGQLWLWLSQPIYQVATGITLSLATGAISDGIDTNSALSSVAVTNNSTRAVPLPKGHILGVTEGRTTCRMRHDVIQAAFNVESFGTHEGLLAVVKFEVTDGVTTVTRYATEETRSWYQDTALIDNTQWAANSNGGSGVFASGSISHTTFAEGEITITATFIPKIGGPAAARSMSWVLACNSAGGYVERVRYCDNVSGNDAWDGTTAAFVSGTTGPKLTVQAAALAAGSVNGGATSPKTVPVVKLVGGTSGSPRTYLAYGGSGTGNAIPSHTHTWLRFEPAEGHDATTVRFANWSGTLTGLGPRIRRMKLRGLTHDISNASDGTGTSSAVLAAPINAVYPFASNPEAFAWEDCVITHRLGKNGQITEGGSGYYYGSAARDVHWIHFKNCSFTDMNQRGPFATASIWGRNNTLIDVCKDALKEPECWFNSVLANNRVAPALLPVSNVSGTPQAGDTVSGLYSGYSATVAAYVPGSPPTVVLDAGFDAYGFKRDDSLTHNAVTVSGVSGTFQVGETLRNAANTNNGIIRAVEGTLLRIQMTLGSAFAAGTLTGVTSGATATWVSNSTQQNLSFSPSGARAMAGPPHPDGLQMQSFRPQELTLTGVTGTFQVGETVSAGSPSRSIVISSIAAQGGGTATLVGADGQTSQWVSSASATVTGGTSGATGMFVSARHVNNDFNGLLYNIVFRNIDGQILFGENGNSGMSIVNVLGILTEGTASYNSSFTAIYNLDAWHITLANQPWRTARMINTSSDLTVMASAVSQIGNSLRFSSFSYIGCDLRVAGAPTSDDAAVPGLDIYKSHVSTTSVFSTQVEGLAVGNPLWTNGVAWNEPHNDAKMDYRPAAGSPLIGLVPAGERAVKYDMRGNLRPNDGSGAAGALIAA